MRYEDYLFAGLDELGRWLREGKCRAEELAEFAQTALQEYAAPLNAVVNYAPERAKAEAQAADAAFAAGQDNGPLQGVPYGAKDLLATGGGLPTSWGTAPLRNQTFEQDATVVRLLKEAGAVLAAKLAMVELAGGAGYSQPNASFTGPCHNPWNFGHWSGGSSTGSAASVGIGALPYAIGSETWGSILSPASYCGVVGMRPTYGLVSRAGAMALSYSLDKIGPIARSATDCARVLEIIGQPDPADHTSSGRSFQFRPEQFENRRWRFGLLQSELESSEAEVSKAIEAVIPRLEEIGTVEVVSLPQLPYAEVARTIIGAEFSICFEDLLISGQISELTAPEDRITPYAFEAISAKDYLRALRIRSRISAELQKALDSVDFLVAQSTVTTAPRVDETFGGIYSRPRNVQLSAASNLAGNPAISLPVGLGSSGLPVGMQLVAGPFEDEALLVAAAQIQARLPVLRLEIAH